MAVVQAARWIAPGLRMVVSNTMILMILVRMILMLIVRIHGNQHNASNANDDDDKHIMSPILGWLSVRILA